MIDAKLQNGDIVTDGAGNAVSVREADARFQRALLCLTAPLGSFIYDRELGTRRLPNTGAQRLELLFSESLARYPGTSVRVLSAAQDCVTVQITIDGESRVEEVRSHGNV